MLQFSYTVPPSLKNLGSVIATKTSYKNYRSKEIKCNEVIEA